MPALQQRAFDNLKTRAHLRARLRIFLSAIVLIIIFNIAMQPTIETDFVSTMLRD